MPKLSICMPSNRKFEDSIRSIQSVLSFVADSEIEFVVSDNSNDPKKQKFFESLAAQNVKYFKGPPGAADNGINAINKSIGNFVIGVSDDDHIVNLGREPFSSMKEIGADVVGIRPGFVVFNPTVGLIKTTSFGVASSHASDRIKEYFHKCQGMNNTIFSAWRRDVLLDVFARCFEMHPTKGEYADWAIVVSLISSGRVLEDKETVLFYNNKNWFGDEGFIKVQVEKLFLNAQLPIDASKHISLFQAIDSYILIMRRTSPLSIAEKVDAANCALMSYLSSYIRTIINRADMSENVQIAVTALSKAKGFFSIMEHVFNVLLLIDKSLAEKYADFYTQVIGAKWGCLPNES